MGRLFLVAIAVIAVRTSSSRQRTSDAGALKHGARASARMLLTPLVTDLLHRSDCPRPRYFQKSLADNLRSEFGTDGFARERNTSGAATEIVRNEWVEQATGGAEVLSLMAAGFNTRLT